MKNRLFYVFAALLVISLYSCKKEIVYNDPPDPDPIMGCTDPNSLNYDLDATLDDGSCEYAIEYIPFSAGNFWELSGGYEIIIPFIETLSVDVNTNFVQTADMTIDGQDYVVMETNTSVAGLFNQDEEYAYRQDGQTGKIYRVNVGEGSTEEELYIDYPLDLNSEWFNNDAQDDLHFQVISMRNVEVNGVVFDDVTEIRYTDLNSGFQYTFSFAKEFGPVMGFSKISIPFIGDIEFITELESWNVN